MERNGTKKYIETVAYLEKLYDYCNVKLFNGELDKPVITIQLDNKNKSYGWFSVDKVWKWQDGKERDAYEINITAQCLNRPIRDIAETMIHKMVHYYAKINNLQDTSRGHVYHNKVYKFIAEKHGLKVDHVKTNGWSCTALTDDTDKLIQAFIKDNPETLIYRVPVFKAQRVKSCSTRKYECPCCGNSVRATKELRVACADCKQLMTLAE